MEPVLVEFPAGLCDDNESPDVTIRREMREEMGMDADRAVWIGRFMLSAGGPDESCDIYVGRVVAPETGSDGIVGVGGLAIEQEDIRVRVWSADAAIGAALAGRFANSITTIGLLWLAAKRPALREEWRR